VSGHYLGRIKVLAGKRDEQGAITMTNELPAVATSLGSDGDSLSDARVPSLPAAVWVRKVFLDVEMPPRFVLECLTPDGSWIDWGLYEAATFDREADGTYVSATGVGSPMFIRCLRQDGSVVYVVDGAGEPFTYRLVAFPGGGNSER